MAINKKDYDNNNDKNPDKKNMYYAGDLNEENNKHNQGKNQENSDKDLNVDDTDDDRNKDIYEEDNQK